MHLSADMRKIIRNCESGWAAKDLAQQMIVAQRWQIYFAPEL